MPGVCRCFPSMRAPHRGHDSPDSRMLTISKNSRAGGLTRACLRFLILPVRHPKPRACMSDNENQPQLPSKQTSSVPLKKETVRVTLKAADAPPAVPSATVPMAPPVRPPVPGGAPPAPTAPGGAPRPPVPAPTIPLRTAGAPKPAGAPAPTIRLATSTAPIGPPGAATKPPGASPTPTVGPSPTIALKPAGSPSLPGLGGTPTLPKATVQLQPPTQPLGTSFPSASQAATLRVDDDEEEDSANDGVVKILAGVGFAAALALLAFQLMLANTWISVEDNPRTGDWSQLLE